MDLQTPLKDLGRTFALQVKRLEKLGVRTAEDLLFYFPARYEDLSLVSKINIVQPGETVTIQGKLVSVQNVYTRRASFQIQKARVKDETGSIECVWFNQPYITRVLHEGAALSIAGRVEQSGRNLSLVVSDYEVLKNGNQTLHTGRLVPIYPLTAGLSPKWLRNRINELLDQHLDSIEEHLPREILDSNDLIQIQEAIKTIHFPATLEEAARARIRLAFDEFFFIQLGALSRKKEWEKKTTAHVFSVSTHRSKIDEFISSLPFELTKAQRRALDDIGKDLERRKPMNRLLEGEVGSGKTVVAAVTMYAAYLNGYQSVFMAPTSILAEQHFRTISNLLEPLGVKVGLALGGRNKTRGGATRIVKRKTSDDTESQTDIHQTSYDIYVGTHALLSEKIKFSKLGLVVIDEQQRFGVAQRAMLREKGENPHVLILTATPIPRTVFLTLYGDLDLSLLDEMPTGRIKVKTWLVPIIKRNAAYDWIKKQINESGQVFVVCPFIEESESMATVRAATHEYENLKKIFKEQRVGLLHGRMKAKEKNRALEEFRNKKLDILVATPVVEVGVDIPNATIMVIEGAERFGLAQLHQLRGRVGRSDKQSYCLLFTEETSEHSKDRLKALETMQNGAELAELDLRLRGPGDMFGTAQHGIPLLKIASFSNFPLIEKTRLEAEKVIERLARYPRLQEKLKSTIIGRVAPD